MEASRANVFHFWENQKKGKGKGLKGNFDVFLSSLSGLHVTAKKTHLPAAFSCIFLPSFLATAAAALYVCILLYVFVR